MRIVTLSNIEAYLLFQVDSNVALSLLSHSLSQKDMDEITLKLLVIGESGVGKSR